MFGARGNSMPLLASCDGSEFQEASSAGPQRGQASGSTADALNLMVSSWSFYSPSSDQGTENRLQTLPFTHGQPPRHCSALNAPGGTCTPPTRTGRLPRGPDAGLTLRLLGLPLAEPTSGRAPGVWRF